jgi:anti-sigma factor RsiW
MNPLIYRTPEWQDSIAGYVLGDLTSAEAERVRDSIATDPQIEKEVAALQATLSLLPLALPDAAPTMALRTQILEAAQTQSVSHRLQQPRRRSRLPWLIGSLATVFALGGIGWGWQSYYHSGEMPERLSPAAEDSSARSILSQPDLKLIPLTGTQLQPQAGGNLAIAPSSQQVIIALDRLAPLPATHTYRLWGSIDDRVNNLVNLGVDLRPDASGRVLLKLSLDRWQGITNAIVTIESRLESRQPSTQIVVRGRIAGNK